MILCFRFHSQERQAICTNLLLTQASLFGLHVVLNAWVRDKERLVTVGVKPSHGHVYARMMKKQKDLMKYAIKPPQPIRSWAAKHLEDAMTEHEHLTIPSNQ